MDYAYKIKQHKLYQVIKSLTIKEQDKIFKIFEKKIPFNSLTTILDIGTTPNLGEEHNNILKLYPYTRNITCLSNQDCSIVKSRFKDITIIKNNSENLELVDNSFDIVHCKATLEHVGNYASQIKFVSELLRVCSKYVFLTTPNRFYPIDFHTLHPFIHWLPRKIHRKILGILGEDFYKHEENLRLLSKKDVVGICEQNMIESYEIITHKFLGLSSNFIVVIKK